MVSLTQRKERSGKIGKVDKCDDREHLGSPCYGDVAPVGVFQVVISHHVPANTDNLRYGQRDKPLRKNYRFFSPCPIGNLSLISYTTHSSQIGFPHLFGIMSPVFGSRRGRLFFTCE